MTTAAVQETAGAPDSPPATTVTGVLFPDWPAWAGDESEETTLELFEVAPSDAVLADVERPRLLTLADRLLKHLATDESEIGDITAAAKAEVALITGRYEALAQKASKRAAWKRFALEQLAALLFPDAKAKSKSINLPYGTIGRRDFKPAPELEDEQVAVGACIGLHPDLVKVIITTSYEELEDWLVSAFKRIELDGEEGSQTLTQSVRDEIDNLIGQSDRGEGLEVALALRWGELKKLPSTTGLPPAGVRVTEPRTLFFAEVTEG